MSCVAPESQSYGESRLAPISRAEMFSTAGVSAGSFEFAAGTNVTATAIVRESTPASLEAFKTVASELTKTILEVSCQYGL